uniref:Uncharacterized protein n=1 Tax=Anguilla anguilla TaxID=7936 RepID=A0A0E9SDP7_ANGAN
MYVYVYIYTYVYVYVCISNHCLLFLTGHIACKIVQIDPI